MSHLPWLAKAPSAALTVSPGSISGLTHKLCHDSNGIEAQSKLALEKVLKRRSHAPEINKFSPGT
jgi:hypothetical protein